MYIPNETPEEKKVLDQIERDQQSEVDKLVELGGFSRETCDFLIRKKYGME